MKNIRRSVFETNSSSMHSLSIIGSSKMHDGKFKNKICLEFDEFGWGYDRLSTPTEKASYLITEYSDDRNMLGRIVKVFEDYTGSAVFIPEINEVDYHANGYIDHQSQGMICKFITDDNSIRDLLFDERYSIIIDNDNH